jgi:hypothetical protein
MKLSDRMQMYVVPSRTGAGQALLTAANVAGGAL